MFYFLPLHFLVLAPPGPQLHSFALTPEHSLLLSSPARSPPGSASPLLASWARFPRLPDPPVAHLLLFSFHLVLSLPSSLLFLSLLFIFVITVHHLFLFPSWPKGVSHHVRRLLNPSRLLKFFLLQLVFICSDFAFCTSVPLSELSLHVLCSLTLHCSAYDLISRRAMLAGLAHIEGGRVVLPFVKLFYGAPSQNWWEDDEGVVHEIDQGEGGEQGDALMPLLFSLGQHNALHAVQERLLPNERIFAFLDDVYVVCLPDRVAAIHMLLENALWVHARIRVHAGKTKIFNRAGERPEACDHLERIARTVSEEARVWRGGADIPEVDQGPRDPIGASSFRPTSISTSESTPTSSVGPHSCNSGCAISLGALVSLRGRQSHVFHQSGAPRVCFQLCQISRHSIVGVFVQGVGCSTRFVRRFRARCIATSSGIWWVGIAQRRTHLLLTGLAGRIL